MRLRFTERAIRHLTSIRNFIAKDNIEAAARVVASIVNAAYRLEKFPLSGRAGRVEGTRELVIPGLPYILCYRIADELVLILSIVHTSRKWPKKL